MYTSRPACRQSPAARTATMSRIPRGSARTSEANPRGPVSWSALARWAFESCWTSCRTTCPRRSTTRGGTVSSSTVRSASSLNISISGTGSTNPSGRICVRWRGPMGPPSTRASSRSRSRPGVCACAITRIAGRWDPPLGVRCWQRSKCRRPARHPASVNSNDCWLPPNPAMRTGAHTADARRKPWRCSPMRAGEASSRRPWIAPRATRISWTRRSSGSSTCCTAGSSPANSATTGAFSTSARCAAFARNCRPSSGPRTRASRP